MRGRAASTETLRNNDPASDTVNAASAAPVTKWTTMSRRNGSPLATARHHGSPLAAAVDASPWRLTRPSCRASPQRPRLMRRARRASCAIERRRNRRSVIDEAPSGSARACPCRPTPLLGPLGLDSRPDTVASAISSPGRQPRVQPALVAPPPRAREHGAYRRSGADSQLRSRPDMLEVVIDLAGPTGRPPPRSRSGLESRSSDAPRTWRLVHRWAAALTWRSSGATPGPER